MHSFIFVQPTPNVEEYTQHICVFLILPGPLPQCSPFVSEITIILNLVLYFSMYHQYMYASYYASFKL